jgi:hypothetical protein
MLGGLEGDCADEKKIKDYGFMDQGPKFWKMNEGRGMKGMNGANNFEF